MASKRNYTKYELNKSVILAPICFLTVIIIYVVLELYRNIINLLLRIKLGEKYGGLLPKPDSMFFTSHVSTQYITSTVILKSDRKRNILDGIRRNLQKKVFDRPNDYPKLTSTLATFGGYPYLIKNNNKLDECVTPLSIPNNRVFDEECLKEITGQFISEPLPQNNTGLWQFLTSEKPLELDVNDGYYYYSVIAKFHHIVTDGTSLMSFILNVLADERVEVYSEKLFEKTPNTKHKKSHLTIIKMYLAKINEVLKIAVYILFTGLGKFIQQSYLKSPDKNVLHGPRLSGEKIVAWSVEERMEFVPKVKDIKNRTNSKFSNVILTAISSSITGFFKRNSHQVPETFTAVLPVLLDFPKLDPAKPVPLENKFSFVYFKVPTYSNSFLGTLEEIERKYKREVNDADIKASRFILKHIGTLPINVIKALPSFQTQTCIVTNVPGGPQVNIVEGCVAKKMIPFPPNLNEIGLTIGILTYDDRFQIGIVVDKALLNSQKEAQRIVDDIFYYIKKLNKELDLKHKSE